MRFSDIKGNDAAIGALRSMVDEGRVPHAMLFYENPSSGGLALATAFIQYLNCQNRHDGQACGECPSCRQMAKLIHPDVHYIFPVNTGGVIKASESHPVSEQAISAFRQLFIANPYFTEQDLYEALGVESKSGNISVYEAKDILGKLSLSALTGGYRAVIMFLPERMNAACANKLLKILEEPPALTVFVLVTQNPDSVMGTIFSRCQGLRVLPSGRAVTACADVPEEIRGIWDSLLQALQQKNLFDALDAADSLGAIKSREKQKSFCIYASEKIRQIFLCSKGLQDIAYADGPCPQMSSRFCTRAAAALDNASMLIGRNVSAKIVFTDLVNRLYTYL